MAGHSQFKNIMFRKGKQDKERSKLFAKLSREITVAAKMGMPDPDMNPRLRAAVNAAKAQQIINPDAALNKDPVAGIDGQAADAAMDRYHKSFVTPPATPNVFNIGVTSGGTTGSGGGSSSSSK